MTVLAPLHGARTAKLSTDYPWAVGSLARFAVWGHCAIRKYRKELDIIAAHAASVRVPTWTIVDEETGAVTVQRRAWGTLEGLG